MALSISVSASIQSAPPVTGTAATSLRPNSRTFSLTGTMGTTIVSGDIVAMWGSNDGGRTYQPLRTAAGQQVLLTFGNPECVINDACDHYATQRVGVGTGSALVAVGLSGEGVYVNPSPAWVQGGNAGFAPTGVLGTTDSADLDVISHGVTIAHSDGSVTLIGNTEVAVPGNGLALSAGDSGLQIICYGAGELDLQSESGPLKIDTTGGDIDIGGSLPVQKDVNIGSAVGASSVAIVGGTGGVGLGSNPVAQTVNIGNQTGATSVLVVGGTGAMSFGANAVAHTVTIGSVTGAAATALRAGTGGLTIVNNGQTWTWPTALGAAGTKLTDAAGNGVLSFT